MFIRIIRDKHDSIYECERVHFDSKDNDHFFIRLEPSGITIEIDKTVPTLAVYCMNNKGKTIDTIFKSE